MKIKFAHVIIFASVLVIYGMISSFIPSDFYLEISFWYTISAVIAIQISLIKNRKEYLNNIKNYDISSRLRVKRGKRKNKSNVRYNVEYWTWFLIWPIFSFIWFWQAFGYGLPGLLHKIHSNDEVIYLTVSGKSKYSGRNICDYSMRFSEIRDLPLNFICVTGTTWRDFEKGDHVKANVSTSYFGMSIESIKKV